MGTTQNPNNHRPFLTTAPDFAGSARPAPWWIVPFVR